ncbi:MAG TPA: NADP-dependent phosphogluconate dehydrogenase [Chitinophagaceae bacterium]|nr:NADP-dependent phosphogluconate dehydrogenase [Chitinophagaceae bacterium]
MSNASFDFGMIGLGTMGRNLLLNVADHGFAAIGFDKDITKGQLLESSAAAGTRVKGVSTLADLVSHLKAPRKIMMLVPAGAPVDAVIKEVLPLLTKGDIIIDGGNSHFTDTLRRIDELKDTGIHFIGMGVSGGEKGARRGPSIMPGGDIAAWKELKPVLEAISAKVNNEPCVAYMGKNAAGHYVKMVHNGIEYAIMQIISEVYDFMKRGLGMSNAAMHEVFKSWNEGELQSFLVEITAALLPKKDDKTGGYLTDVILDKAGSKGTGKWTSQEAMDLPVPLPTIDMAVTMRDLSGYKAERVEAAALYKPVVKSFATGKDKLVKQLGDALYLSSLLCYAQGLAMLHKASGERQMDIPLKDVVKIWRGGCIIRSAQLELFTAAFKKRNAPANILLDKKIASLVKKKQAGLRRIVQQYAAARIPAAGLMSALAYLDAYTSDRMPTNIIQAQRDYFGAHTYQRIDAEGSFHTAW